MDQTSFRVLAALLIGAPLLGAAGFVAHPKGRAFIVALGSPPPTLADRSPAADAGPALPPLAAALGAESVELRTLREDTPATNGLSEPTRAHESALWAVGPNGALAAPSGAYSRPSALRRADLPAREDPNVDLCLHALAADSSVRVRFTEALQRYAHAKLETTRITSAWKLPSAIVAVAFVESGFRAEPMLQSDAGAPDATGIWRLTPDVSHVYGLSMLPTYDERRGLASGTEAAAHYLADLRERFGSWELALVAFGFGYRATLEELGRRGTHGFWEIAPSLPPSISVYVTSIVATALVLANLDRFGLGSAAKDDPISTSELDVSAGTSLDLVAQAAGVAPSLVRSLNPEYTSGVVPRTDFAMAVRVPSETLVRARELLPRLGAEGPLDAGPESDASAPAPAPPAPVETSTRIYYRVQEGDSVASLATQYDVAPSVLASDNALDPTASLRPGMILAIRRAAVPDPPKTPPASKPRKAKQHGR